MSAASRSSAAGINSFTVNGNMLGSTVDVTNGIPTITVGRQVNGSFFREENPLTAGSARSARWRRRDYRHSIEANTIGTLKTPPI